MSVIEKNNRVAELVEQGQPVFESIYQGLYLDVKSKGTASWIFRYQLFGNTFNLLTQ